MEDQFLNSEGKSFPLTMNHSEDMECSFKDQKKADSKRDGDLFYSLEDNPPWYMAVLLGLQQYMTAFGATLTVPLVLAGPLCIGDDFVGLSELISTIFFVSGIATLLQTTLGIRLPLIQGATFAFLTPTISILKQPQWICPQDTNNTEGLVEAASNGTNLSSEVIWHSRMREIQGAICVASLVQVLVGATGIMSLVLRFVGPLTITPTITLIGLCLFRVAADKAATHWGIAFMTVSLVAIFSQYLSWVDVTLPSYDRRTGWRKTKMPIFKLFPILLAILTSWFVCFVLTEAGVFPDAPSSQGYLARTDIRLHTIEMSAWIRVPYPGQWGTPTVSAGAVFGMMAGVLASMIESIGDYFACARLAGLPPPPPRAVNRGVMMEGFGCIIAGLIGSGNGTTSYSENVAAIGITRVASRRVIQFTGILLVVMGCVGKVGAVFITIPDPVVGGIFLCLFGIVASVGLTNLQFVDLNSTRNVFVLACSLFLGLAIPDWLNRNPDAIQIAIPEVQQTVHILLTTSMFVGGAVGFFLDATIPGTPEERGLIGWRAIKSQNGGTHDESEHIYSAYDLPYVSGYLRRQRWTQYVPFCVSKN